MFLRVIPGGAKPSRGGGNRHMILPKAIKKVAALQLQRRRSGTYQCFQVFNLQCGALPAREAAPFS